MNGVLKYLVHGTRYAELQICLAITIYFNLSSTKLQTFRPNTRINAFCNKLELANRNRRKLTSIADKTFIAGTFKIITSLPVYLSNALQNNLLENKKNFIIFNKLLKAGVLYDSETYLIQKKNYKSRN